MQNIFEQSWFNLEPIFILESCQEQMITSNRIELQISNTTHFKEHFKAFLMVIWFLYLHNLDVEKKHFSQGPWIPILVLGEIWTGNIWELITAKPTKPLTYTTSQLKDLFKIFPTVILFLCLFWYKAWEILQNKFTVNFFLLSLCKQKFSHSKLE